MNTPHSIPSYIATNVSLNEYTTFHIGGLARYFAQVNDEQTLNSVLQWAHEKQVPIKVIGEGSNILVSDAGFDGLIVRMGLKGVTATVRGVDVEVVAAAGESWDDFVQYCVTKGWWGIENLSLIPGTVGACAVQNVGAYGTEAKDVVTKVETIDMSSGAKRVFSNEECTFKYRDSFFKTDQGRLYVVTKVHFSLSLTPQPKLQYKDLALYFNDDTNTPTLSLIRDAVISIRSKKFPDIKSIGTAGSFFKNPVVTKEQKEKIETLYPTLVSYMVDDAHYKLSAAWLIDNILGYRGVKEGAVGTYSEQALVVVNHGGATAQEVIHFVTQIKNKLEEKIKVTLEWEVELV